MMSANLLYLLKKMQKNRWKQASRWQILGGLGEIEWWGWRLISRGLSMLRAVGWNRKRRWWMARMPIWGKSLIKAMGLGRARKLLHFCRQGRGTYLYYDCLIILGIQRATMENKRLLIGLLTKLIFKAMGVYWCDIWLCILISLR